MTSDVLSKANRGQNASKLATKQTARKASSRMPCGCEILKPWPLRGSSTTSISNAATATTNAGRSASSDLNQTAILEYRISKKRIISLNEVFGPLPAFVLAATRIHGLTGEIVPNSTDSCIRYFFADRA